MQHPVSHEQELTKSNRESSNGAGGAPRRLVRCSNRSPMLVCWGQNLRKVCALLRMALMESSKLASCYTRRSFIASAANCYSLAIAPTKALKAHFAERSKLRINEAQNHGNSEQRPV